MGVVEIHGRQPVAHDPDELERVVPLGDDLLDRSLRIHVHRDHPPERGVAVGLEVQAPGRRPDRHEVRIGLADHRAHDRGLDAARQVGDVHAVHRVRAPVDRDDQEAAVVEDLGVEGPLGLPGCREHQAIVGGRRADPVEAQLHVAVRRVVRRVGRRLREAAVEEPGVVGRPGGLRELRPPDPVRELLAGRDAPDRPRPPVGARVADGAGHELAALRDDRRRERGRAAVAEAVGVEDDRPLPARFARRPQDVLVLQAGVPELEPAVAAPPRGTGAREVPQLAETRADGVASGCLGKHAVRQRVLRSDPRPGRRRVGVLERPVRVGDPVAVVLVHLVRRRGRGVGQPRRRRHRVIRGRDRRGRPRPPPRDGVRRGHAWPCGRRTAPRTAACTGPR